MIKKHLIFHSLFLLFISIWLLVIFNVILNAYSISFLTSPSGSLFAGYFGLFYWVIVGVSAATSGIIGLDKLGLLPDLWAKNSFTNKGDNKPEIIVAPKKPKVNPSKVKSKRKKKVIVEQNNLPVGIVTVNKTTSQKDLNRKKDKMKAFYLFGETEFKKCEHKLGYLGDKLKNKPIPDECFGCPKLLDCFKSTKKSKNKKPELATIL